MSTTSTTTGTDQDKPVGGSALAAALAAAAEHDARRYVITGGPSSGKDELIEAILAAGIACMRPNRAGIYRKHRERLGRHLQREDRHEYSLEVLQEGQQRRQVGDAVAMRQRHDETDHDPDQGPQPSNLGAPRRRAGRPDRRAALARLTPDQDGCPGPGYGGKENVPAPRPTSGGEDRQGEVSDMADAGRVSEDDQVIGRRARRIRTRRGLSLDTAAGLAGITKSYLSKLELGERRFIRRGLIEDLAQALSCSVSDLTGQPYLPADRASAEALAAVPGIRFALHEYGPDDIPEVSPRPLEVLVQCAGTALESCAQAQYSVAGRNIGALLASLQSCTATGCDRDRVFTAAVATCFSAGVVASRTGNVDLSLAAARRGVDLARRQDNAGLTGFAYWYWALELTSVAARARAQAVLADGIDGLTPSVRWGHGADSRPAEVVGLMHLQQARAAARERRVDDARSHLGEAADLAGRVGERNGFRQHFGPTNVAAWRVSIGIELGEGPRAYEEITRSGLDVAALGSAERSSSLYLDCARALAQDGGSGDGEAIRHLDTADRIAPQRVRTDPIARDLVADLDRRAKRRVWELDSLKRRLGVA